jgi:hypothetical protein
MLENRDYMYSNVLTLCILTSTPQKGTVTTVGNDNLMSFKHLLYIYIYQYGIALNSSSTGK